MQEAGKTVFLSEEHSNLAPIPKCQLKYTAWTSCISIFGITHTQAFLVKIKEFQRRGIGEGLNGGNKNG